MNHTTLRNRLLVNLHLLIREYALIIGKNEDEVKQGIKKELNIESFADYEEMDMARASAFVQRKIDNHGKN